MSLPKNKKDPSEIVQTKPEQLELFELNDQHSNRYSNTIEVYDMMPKYFFGGVKRKMEQYLDVLERDFVYRERKFNLTIAPAAILDKNSGKTIFYYPSQREELVEDVLRKFAATRDRGIYLDGEAGVKFTLYEVQKELKKIGHGYDLNEIKQAIEICAKTSIEIKSADAKISYVSNIFPLAIIDRKDRADGDNMALVQFHPLVTKSINEGTFRLINYERMMSMKMQLARWFHKRISHLFVQGDTLKPYVIKLSTILRDSAMKSYKNISDTIRQVNKAMDELVDAKIISKYEIDKNYHETKQNKIVDALYSLWVSEDFVADAKKANKLKNLELEEERKANISDDDFVELKRELEKDIYGLSRTVINNLILGVKSKDHKEKIMWSLKAAEEWISANKNKDFNPAQVTRAAIRDQYIPKSVNTKKEKEIEKKNKKTEDSNSIRGKKINRDKFWNKFLKNLEKRLGKEAFDKWVKDIKLNSSYESEIVIEFPTKFLRDWIKREYAVVIKEIWKEIDDSVKNVVIIATQAS